MEVVVRKSMIMNNGVNKLSQQKGVLLAVADQELR